MKQADWKGALTKRFRWGKFRFEWGRWCYKTNWAGSVLDYWWEWESESVYQAYKGATDEAV